MKRSLKIQPRKKKISSYNKDTPALTPSGESSGSDQSYDEQMLEMASNMMSAFMNMGDNDV